MSRRFTLCSFSLALVLVFSMVAAAAGPLAAQSDVGPLAALGTAAVMFKGDIEGGSCSYGMSLTLHPLDRQQLQHYVFKRQAGILSSIKNLSL